MKKFLLVLTSLLLTLVALSQQVINPETALSSYLNNEDCTKAWEIRDTYMVDKVQAFSLLLISQKWQGILWKHELIVLAPDTIDYDGSLLFISGGSVKDGMPNFSKHNDETTQFMAKLADKNKAIVALLRQVPNQPLYDGLYEDALISYTLNEFKKDSDYSWPLLFPMVKSVRKAMDAIQELSSKKLNQEINRFVLSGASKRGWTTWLTGASQDPRIIAIAPMVIDMLNMPVTLEYQKEMYGEYSEQIEDYVKLEIPQAINSEFGNALVKMIDPYSYKDKLTMPKMIFLGTNDEYWTVDAVKHYIDEIPGDNLLHYVANAGHKLGDKKQAFKALSAFFALNLNKYPLPVNTWLLKEKRRNINLEIEADGNQLLRTMLWTASSKDRDFREAKWTSEEIKLNKKSKSKIDAKIKYPKSGYKAFYVDLFYPDPNGGEYSVSTRTYVTDKKHVFVK
ncbi:MAG: PhoPQ-activated protein PqaA family protein [Dysgonamonadaceae bacterium]|nr:PhoPQ-activated protein PqaA family protein [Dysgonamonadaceae bacterium]MDD3356136.1 PhoPQ-activated protein PqaA family protein [Dysgonamonadaceae bacterium]MDD4247167.1 PhoPQ-activated protein PqaA family protein [Dysgonamonadaceae bacterium]MDD4604962.1 PhoPQ-activated protein PqaA family protein [Dysgonamonadaceae bacterium]HUI32981.1 PhoPQ-activated protein PqaA family protein [Dysgonamonadaceae bacterium]